MIRLTIALALAATGLHAEPHDLLQTAATELSGQIDVPVVLVRDATARAASSAMTVRIPAWAEHPANLHEARALLAVLAAYQSPIDVPGSSRTRRTLETVAAIGAEVAVSANHRYRDGYRNGHGPSTLDTVPLDDDGTGGIRATRTLALLGKMGSCTGALVAAMNRVQAAGPSGNARLLFNHVRADLGRLIYPPDETCISR